MTGLATVKENDNFIFQVDRDMSENTIKRGAYLTKTYEMKNLKGVKNLSASFLAKTDLKTLNFDSTGTVKYKMNMRNGSSMEMGVRCSLSNGEVVVPMMLHNENGLSVGIEVKATLDLKKLMENGVNLVVGIPYGGGHLVIKWNPLSEKFTVQLRKNLPKKGEDDDDDDDDEDLCHVLELSPTRGLLPLDKGLLLIENNCSPPVQIKSNQIHRHIPPPVHRIENAVIRKNVQRTNIEIKNKVVQTQSKGIFGFLGDIVDAVGDLLTPNSNSNDRNKNRNTNYVCN